MPFWTVPKIWPNSTVFLIGGGPSIRNIDLSVLKDKRVIGINNAYRKWPWIDAVYFGDCRWWDEHKEHLKEYAGLQITCCERLEKIHHLKVIKRSAKMRGIERNPKALCWNLNSGASAVNLAVHFGAKKIVLVGFDMKVDEKGNHNWHNEHPHIPKSTIYQTNFIPSFSVIAKDLKQMGIECVNTSMNSSLEFFPKISLGECYE